MPNVLKISVENPDELLDAGAYGAGALIRVQTAALEAGPFADVSGTGSTPTIPIVSGTRIYPAFDPNGTSSSWYRTRYENAGGSRLSDWSSAFQTGTNAFCQLYDVKQRLERTGDTSNDEDFADLIGQVSDFIRGKTGRDFGLVSGTFLFDGYAARSGGRCLSIPRGVSSISLLEAAATTGGSFATIPSTAYVLRPAALDRTPGWPATEVWLTDNPAGSPYSRFPLGYDNVRLTGVIGMAVPARIEQVCLNTVVRAWASRQAGQNDMVGTATDSGLPVISRHLSREDRETLEAFGPVLVG